MEIYKAALRKDIQSITGIDLLGCYYTINSALKLSWNVLLPESCRESLLLAAIKFERISNAYFNFDKTKYSTPIPMLEELEEKWEEIVEEELKDFAQNILSDPISYHIRLKMQVILNKLPSKLLDVAAVHKYDEEYLREHYFPEYSVED